MKGLPTKPLLRPDEVASYFDVTTRTVRRWIAGGKLKAEKLSRPSVRITRHSVLRLRRASRGEAPG